MKRVLLVSYYFPPLAGSGVFRPLRLAKHLPGAGWSVDTLTVSDRVRVLKDPGLQAEVPEQVRIHRAPSVEPRNLLLLMHRLGLGALARGVEPWFFVPDDQRGWVPFAVRTARRVLRQTRYDAVLTTSGPVSAHLVGWHLKCRGLPWIADFRDEWTTNPYLSYPTAWHRRLNERWERRVLRGADRVVCVSEPWLARLQARVPGEDPAKFRTLPNGYDADHFDPRPAPPPERFRVVYTGTFYGHRSPSTFLEAVDRVVRQGLVPAEDLEVVFVGHRAAGEPAARLPAGLLRVIGQRPYHEALELLKSAAVLLLVIPPEGGPGNHTGKLFNYLASGRPILALAPRPNVAVELIERTRSGVAVAPTDVPAIARALVGLHAAWRARRPLPDQDRAAVAAFEARPQAAAYARLLDELKRPLDAGDQRPVVASQ